MNCRAVHQHGKLVILGSSLFQNKAETFICHEIAKQEMFSSSNKLLSSLFFSGSSSQSHRRVLWFSWSTRCPSGSTITVSSSRLIAPIMLFYYNGGFYFFFVLSFCSNSRLLLVEQFSVFGIVSCFLNLCKKKDLPLFFRPIQRVHKVAFLDANVSKSSIQNFWISLKLFSV